MKAATGILGKWGVTLQEEKTRIVPVQHGFEFLGFQIKRGARPLRLSADRIRSSGKAGGLYAYPRQKSLDPFKEQIPQRTKRKIPKDIEGLIAELNPVIRGWGNYYCKAHMRRLFHRLDRWIVRRLWSHHCKRWRDQGWQDLPTAQRYGERGLVNLVSRIPSLTPRPRAGPCESRMQEICRSGSVRGEEDNLLAYSTSKGDE